MNKLIIFVAKLTIVVAACLTLGALFVGCHSNYTTVDTGTDFNVVRMKDTGVLYYKGNYIMAPYISENGKFCKLVDGEIVEIDEEMVEESEK